MDYRRQGINEMSGSYEWKDPRYDYSQIGMAGFYTGLPADPQATPVNLQTGPKDYIADLGQPPGQGGLRDVSTYQPPRGQPPQQKESGGLMAGLGHAFKGFMEYRRKAFNNPADLAFWGALNDTSWHTRGGFPSKWSATGQVAHALTARANVLLAERKLLKPTTYKRVKVGPNHEQLQETVYGQPPRFIGHKTQISDTLAEKELSANRRADYKQGIKPKTALFGKYDPDQYTTESVKAAKAAGDETLLVKREKEWRPRETIPEMRARLQATHGEDMKTWPEKDARELAQRENKQAQDFTVGRELLPESEKLLEARNLAEAKGLGTGSAKFTTDQERLPYDYAQGVIEANDAADIRVAVAKKIAENVVAQKSKSGVVYTDKYGNKHTDIELARLYEKEMGIAADTSALSTALAFSTSDETTAKIIKLMDTTKGYSEWAMDELGIDVYKRQTVMQTIKHPKTEAEWKAYPPNTQFWWQGRMWGGE